MPDGGPALDFCTPDTALLVPARRLRLGTRWAGAELAGEATALEVNPADLRRRLRWAFQHRRELAEMGRRAAAWVGERFTWDHAARVADRRLRELIRA